MSKSAAIFASEWRAREKKSSRKSPQALILQLQKNAKGLV